MANFDIITATTRAYKMSWEERGYLARLVAVPLFIKLLCFTLAARFAPEQEQYLRFMLIMIPAFIAEGWMLSHYVRLIVLGHRWPFRPTGDMQADFAVLSVRARGVLSGMIVYTLLNMAVGLLVALVTTMLMPYIPQGGEAHVAIPGHVAFLSMILLVTMFWGFRLLWIYIPYALNQSPLTFLLPLKGVTGSLNLIGLWLLCFIPFFLGLRLFAALLAVPVQSSFGEQAGSFVLIILTVLADTIKSLLTTAGVTYAYRDMVENEDESTGRRK